MPALPLGSVSVDLDRRAVDRDGVREHLTTLEAALLRYLLDAGRTVSRDELHEQVWGYAPTVASRTCDAAIRRLRVKIEDDPSHPEVLLTVHGSGWRIGGADLPAPAPREPASPRRYELGDRVLDLGRTRVECGAEAFALTGREVDLLEALIAAGGASVDQDVLQRRIWGSAAGRALHNTILRVRRKIEPDPAEPRFLVRTACGYRLDLPELAPAPTSAPPAPAPPALPAEVDRRFGREADIASVVAAFDAGHRLVSLTGPPGVGKTRIALSAAHALSASGHRAVWIDASGVEQLDGLYVAFAGALGMRLGTDPPNDLAYFLAGEPDPGPTLVVDNLEQIAGAGAALERLLTSVPRLRVLGTSRIRLGARGERIHPVAPLSVDEAVALFADRVPRPLAAPERDHARALVDLLDGLPLAIELAAARAGAFPVEQLRVQQDALRLLVGGPGRSMRAALDGSWALATPWARAALSQLTVFEGRFSADAADAVLDLPPWPEAAWTVDVLQELCDSSLLRVDADVGRFWMLRVIREYAGEHLPGEARLAAEQRHGRWFAGQISAVGAADTPDVLFGPRRHEILGILSEALSDLAAAIDRAVARGDGGVAVGAARGAWETWWIGGPYGTALAALDPVLDLALAPAERAWIALFAGSLRTALGEPDRGEQLLHESCALAREVGDPWIEQEAYQALARLHLTCGHDAEVREHVARAMVLIRQYGSWSAEVRAVTKLALLATDLDESREALLAVERLALAHGAQELPASLSRRIGEIAVKQGRFAEAERRLERARTLGQDGDLAEEAALYSTRAHLLRLTGRLAEAIPYQEAAARSWRRLGDRVGEARALLSAGLTLSLLGRHGEGEAAFLRALGVSRSGGFRSTECGVLNALGALAAERTDRDDAVDEAARWFREALDLAIELGEPHREAMSRMNLGKVCCLRGDAEEGLFLLSGALDAYERNGDERRAGGVLVMMAEANADLGRLDEARDRLDAALAIAERKGDGGLLGSARRISVGVAARMGRLDEAAQGLAALEAEPTDNAVFRAEILMARAELAHARGDAAGRAEALAGAASLANPAIFGARFRTLASGG